MDNDPQHPAAHQLTQIHRMVAWCAAHRWPVFPCRADKRPLTRHGFKDATCDLAQLRTWWASEPHPIGLATGATGLIVIDLDTPKPATVLPPEWASQPGVIDGSDILATLAEQAGQPWPTTRTITTPTGGQHLYFRAPTGTEFTSSAGKLAPLIDIRAHGGYVIIPPSTTSAGTYTTTNPDPITTLPAWLEAALNSSGHTTGGSTPAQATTTAKPAAPAAATSRDRAARYTQAAITGELRDLLAATPGSRNHALNRAAFNLGQLIPTGHLTPADIHTTLTPTALAIGLTQTETAATIASGITTGARTPRKAAA